MAEDAGHRGRLRIDDRVVERIAAQAARENRGVVTVGSRLEQVVGRRYPKVDAEVAGSRVRIVVEIAAVWPIPLAETTKAVRDTVAWRVGSLVGLHVDSVDVHAARIVVQDDDVTRGRVR